MAEKNRLVMGVDPLFKDMVKRFQKDTNLQLGLNLSERQITRIIGNSYPKLWEELINDKQKAK